MKIEPMPPLSPQESAPALGYTRPPSLRQPTTLTEVQEATRGGHTFTRRALLGAVVGAGATYVVDSLVTRARWPQTHSELAEFQYGSERWLVMPGLGQYDGYPLAKSLGADGLKDQEISYFNYAAQGITTEDLADGIATFSGVRPRLIDRLEPLNGFLNSMGGAAFIESLRVLRNRYDSPRPLPKLGKIVLNCAPFDVWDIYDYDGVEFLQNIPYRGSAIGKMIIESARRIKAGHATYEEIEKSIHEGIKTTLNGLPPAMWMSQIKLLATADPMHDIDDFQGIITKDTRVLFCLPEHSPDDTVVVDDQAFRKWYGFFDYFGVQPDFVRMSGTGHADTAQASRRIRPWLASLKKPGPELGLPPDVLTSSNITNIAQKQTPLEIFNSGVMQSHIA
jgi:hypothetical protein